MTTPKKGGSAAKPVLNLKDLKPAKKVKGGSETKTADHGGVGPRNPFHASK